MKTFFITIMILLLSSCTGTYHAYNDNRIRHLPVFPHNRNVTVYFSKGNMPHKKYIEAALLESHGDFNVSYGDLAGHLSEQAKAYGADAVIITGSPDLTTTWDPEHKAINYTKSLYGIAIIYIDNLDYIRNYKWKESFIAEDKDNGIHKLFDVYYYPDGTTRNIDFFSDSVNYKLYVRDYNLTSLIEETRGWSFKTDKKGRVCSRKRTDYQPGFAKKTTEVKLFMDGRDIIDSLFVKYSLVRNPYNTSYPPYYYSESIRILYNGEENIDKVLVYTSRGFIIEEEYLYNYFGKNTGREYYMIFEGKKSKVMYSEIEYYTPDMLFCSE